VSGKVLVSLLVSAVFGDATYVSYGRVEEGKRGTHKCRYSRRMMMVLVILVEWTTPVRIRPRMETSPVKGHFLSMYVPFIASTGGVSNAQRSACELTETLLMDGMSPIPSTPNNTSDQLFPFSSLQRFHRSSHAMYPAGTRPSSRGVWKLTRWGLEAQTDILVPSLGLGGDLFPAYLMQFPSSMIHPNVRIKITPRELW
jgi:hypothetical protein